MEEPSPATIGPGQSSDKFSLENILGENHELLEHPGTNGAPVGGWDEESPEKPVAEGFCVECEGQLTVVLFFAQLALIQFRIMLCRPTGRSLVRKLPRYILRGLLRGSTSERLSQEPCCEAAEWAEEEDEDEWELAAGCAYIHRSSGKDYSAF